MTWRTRWGGSVLVLLAALSLARAARGDESDALAQFRAAEPFTLANGMRVILLRDTRAPFVALSLRFHVGSAEDPPGLEGMAHLCEHVMTSSTAHVAGAFGDSLGKLEALNANSTTDLERTTFFETFAAANLEPALWLESDRLGFLDAVSEETLQHARQIVRQESAQLFDNRAYSAAEQRRRTALYPAPHPYGRLTSSSDRSVAAVGIADVGAFRARYYTPANATLVLVGNFQTEEAKALVRKYFETLPSPPRPPRLAIDGTPLTHEIVLHEPEKLGKLKRVLIGWKTPAFLAPGDAAADLLSSILTADRASRLGRALDQRLQLTQGTTSHQASHRGTSELWVELRLQPGADPQRAIAALDAELDDLAAHGPTADELATALARRELQLVRGLDGIRGLSLLADRIQMHAYSEDNAGGFAQEHARYRAVTAEQIRQLVRTRLGARQRVVVIAEPLHEAQPGARPTDTDEPATESAQ